MAVAVKELFALSNLRVWAPEPRYMLAMKCISAGWDSADRDDVEFILKHLDLRDPKDVLTITESYYPNNRIPRKTQFRLEELLKRGVRSRSTVSAFTMSHKLH